MLLIAAAAVLGQPEMDPLNTKVFYAVAAAGLVIVALVAVVWWMRRRPTGAGDRGA
jgi:hypothetical protein